MLNRSPLGRHARSALAVVAALALALTGCDQPNESPTEPSFAYSTHGERSRDRGFQVYTQNAFHGGDTSPIFTLDFNDIPAVIAAANVFWGDVQSSDFPERAVEIVDEIERRMPHAVALQEMFRIAILDAGFQPIGGIDMLAVVEAEIAARGLPYTTDAIQDNTDVTLPLGFDPTIPGISMWMNAVDRIATLRRTDVPLVESDQGSYAASLPLGPVTLTRGWTRTALRHGGTTYQVVNTHLEVTELAPVQAGQAAELIGSVLADLDGVTVLAGDLNSNAAAYEGDPTRTPTYDDLLAAGFLDVWARSPRGRRGDGLTCCHPKELTGSQPFDRRIDFVLVRPPSGYGEDDGDDGWWNGRGHFRAAVVGTRERDRTAGGLWPSDHAGLFGLIKLRGRRD